MGTGDILFFLGFGLHLSRVVLGLVGDGAEYNARLDNLTDVAHVEIMVRK